jgi:hypothetical protein
VLVEFACFLFVANRLAGKLLLSLAAKRKLVSQATLRYNVRAHVAIAVAIRRLLEFTLSSFVGS